MLENPINSEKKATKYAYNSWKLKLSNSLLSDLMRTFEKWILSTFFIYWYDFGNEFYCVSECRKYLDLEYFFLSEKNTNVVKSCLHIIWSHWSTVYFKIIFQNDSSSYVLFWVYIYWEKSGRLALDLTFFGSTSLYSFCVYEASWKSSEISSLVNHCLYQKLGKEIDDFKMIFQRYLSTKT